jgi:putative DNA primase/helicase
MMELYGKYEDSLTTIIQNRDQYLNAQDPAYEPYIRIIKTYDMYKQINGTDVDISEALHATCLWYIFKYISGDDEDPMMFLDDQEPDAKGKERAPKLNLNKLAMFLIRKYCIVSANDSIYCYIDDKYYETQDRLSKDLVKLLMVIGYSDHSKVKEIVNDVIYRVKNMTAKFREFPFNKKSKFLIPVKNGVVVRRNLNMLLSQSPVWGFTFSLPVIFDKNADPKPIKEFISNLVDNDDDYELLVQIPSHALLQDENYQQMYLLTGGGANGKSTLISLITRLVGDTNITAVSLQEINENRFSAAELQGKLLNMYPDLPKTSVKTTGKIKALTGADTITVEKKFCPPFKLRNKAVFAFSANSLPEVDDSSFAFWRRWAIINFPYTFKVDPELLGKLTTPENLSGFLNLVIDKMNRIEQYGLTRSSKVEEAMGMWKKRSNSAYAYVTDMLEKSVTDYIRYDTLYNLYLAYCDEQDFTALGKPKFTTELEKIGAILGHATEAQARVKVVKGVKLKKKVMPEMRTEEQDEPITFK